MKSGKFEVAKAYIVYRQEHKKIRETELEAEIKKIESHSFKITKSD
jgi:anaerobic ribonucleoside-triphosphate reductase